MIDQWLILNKSSNFLLLLAHVAIYAVVMSILLIPTGISLTFVAINAILHVITDFVSSKLTTKYYHEGRFYAGLKTA